MENDVIKTLSDLFNATKIKFYNFLNDVVLNTHTLEGIVLSGLVYLFPSHAKDITEFFALYLGFKSSK